VKQADIYAALGIKRKPARKKKAKKKAAKKRAPKKRASPAPARKKKAPARKKKATKKKAKKKPQQRVDRWREQQLYQAKDSPFRGADYEILYNEPGNKNSNISREDVARFLFDHHYIGTVPDGAHYFYGMWHKPSKQLVGVAAYGQPGSPPVLKSSFPGLEDPDYEALDVPRFKQTGEKLWLPAPRKVSQYALELLRLALLREVPKNGESWFVDKTFDRLRAMDKRGIISFSDPIVGHVGTIYKALSAVYTGTSRPEWVWRFPDGTLYHNRHKTKIDAADPCHGSGKSISGIAKAKAVLSKWGGPPRRGECLRKWQTRVLKEHAAREPGPGKMRYVWGLTKTQESEIRQRRKRGQRRLAELRAKGWDEERIRKRMARDRSGVILPGDEEKKPILHPFEYYPCGSCLDPFPDHKTEECPLFDPARGAAQTTGFGAALNPHIRSSVTPCGQLPKASGVHHVERGGRRVATLILDLHNVNLFGPELFYENRCPLLAGFRQEGVKVQRKGVSWQNLPTYAESYELRDLAARVGLPLRRVEDMLIKEGRAWARATKPKSNPPPWAERIMKRHWPMLVAAVGVDRMPAGPGAEEFGCGHYGCVWPTKSGQVVKITSDETEARFIAACLSMGGIEGMVRYHQILQIPGASHRRRPVFVIWRDEAWDVGGMIDLPTRGKDHYEKSQARETLLYLDGFKQHANAAREFLKGRQRRSGDAAILAEAAWKAHGDQPAWSRGMSLMETRNAGDLYYRRQTTFRKADSWIKGVDRVAAHIAACAHLAMMLSNSSAYGYQIGRALDESLRVGILLADVHAMNVGRIEIDANYPGELSWGITDPGHAMFLDPKWFTVKIPELAEVASNPRRWW
jgi:hypothetical protein